jgi:hypothetical protein
MRVANDAKVSAIIAKSNIRRFPCAQKPDRAALDAAPGQEPGRLSDEEQRTEAIQDYIQHDPSPWKGRRAFKTPAVPGDADNVAGNSVGLPWGTAEARIRIP